MTSIAPQLSPPIGGLAPDSAPIDHAGKVTVSIVSHGHGAMVTDLVLRLREFQEVGHIILTLNVSESMQLDQDDQLSIIANPRPLGFGANHNQAFGFCKTQFFCVLNPDISLPENPFPELLRCLSSTPNAVAAPTIISPEGNIEDSVRHFPTLTGLVKKICFGDSGRYCVNQDAPPTAVDWTAGMFLIFPSSLYRSLGGFDTDYFLYYEDVDLCARAWEQGLQVLAVPNCRAVHAAQRASRRSFRHLLMHLRSMQRYLVSWSLNGRITKLGRQMTTAGHRITPQPPK